MPVDSSRTTISRLDVVTASGLLGAFVASDLGYTAGQATPTGLASPTTVLVDNPAIASTLDAGVRGNVTSDISSTDYNAATRVSLGYTSTNVGVPIPHYHGGIKATFTAPQNFTGKLLIVHAKAEKRISQNLASVLNAGISVILKSGTTLGTNYRVFALSGNNATNNTESYEQGSFIIDPSKSNLSSDFEMPKDVSIGTFDITDVREIHFIMSRNNRQTLNFFFSNLFILDKTTPYRLYGGTVGSPTNFKTLADYTLLTDFSFLFKFDADDVNTMKCTVPFKLGKVGQSTYFHAQYSIIFPKPVFDKGVNSLTRNIYLDENLLGIDITDGQNGDTYIFDKVYKSLGAMQLLTGTAANSVQLSGEFIGVGTNSINSNTVLSGKVEMASGYSLNVTGADITGARVTGTVRMLSDRIVYDNFTCTRLELVANPSAKIIFNNCTIGELVNLTVGNVLVDVELNNSTITTYTETNGQIRVPIIITVVDILGGLTSVVAFDTNNLTTPIYQGFKLASHVIDCTAVIGQLRLSVDKPEYYAETFNYSLTSTETKQIILEKSPNVSETEDISAVQANNSTSLIVDKFGTFDVVQMKITTDINYSIAQWCRLHDWFTENLQFLAVLGKSNIGAKDVFETSTSGVKIKTPSVEVLPNNLEYISTDAFIDDSAARVIAPTYKYMPRNISNVAAISSPTPLVVDYAQIEQIVVDNAGSGGGLDEAALHTALDNYTNKDDYKADLTVLNDISTTQVATIVSTSENKIKNAIKQA